MEVQGRGQFRGFLIHLTRCVPSSLSASPRVPLVRTSRHKVEDSAGRARRSSRDLGKLSGTADAPEVMAKLIMILPSMILHFWRLTRIRTDGGKIMGGKVIGKRGFAISCPTWNVATVIPKCRGAVLPSPRHPAPGDHCTAASGPLEDLSGQTDRLADLRIQSNPPPTRPGCGAAPALPPSAKRFYRRWIAPSTGRTVKHVKISSLQGMEAVNAVNQKQNDHYELPIQRPYLRLHL